MTVLLLRFDAPLMSFGGPAIDQHGVVETFPALSMLTGLLANALGWDHRDADRLDALQDRLRYAARIDRAGEALRDYQTVDLGQGWMLPEKAGWTTRGAISGREGANDRGTHERLRHYRADSLCTVALAVIGDETPTGEDLVNALRQPARPLFIGRKCCVPAAPLLLGIVEAPSFMDVLARVPRARRSDEGPLSATWWDGDPAGPAEDGSRVVPMSDERDWRNRVHVGRRLMREGRVNPPKENHA